MVCGPDARRKGFQTLAKDNLFKKRKELQRFTSDLDEDSRRLRQMSRQSQQLEAHVEHLQDAHAQVDGELQDQLRKLDAVTERVGGAARRVAAARSSRGTWDDRAARTEVARGQYVKGCHL